MERSEPIPDFELTKPLPLETGACSNGAYLRVTLFKHDNVKLEIYGEGFSSCEKAREYAIQVCRAFDKECV